jgi:transposase InsO family protein
MHKLPFTPSQSKTHRVGELIHSDLVEPMQVPSPNGAIYYVLFKEDFSRSKAVYFLKLKSETSESFKSFSLKIFTETGNKIETLRSDNGGEFTGQDFKDWMAVNGIRQQTSAAYTPEQNGKAERDHRTTVEAARSQIHAKGIPLKLWAEAVNHSVYT